MVQLLGPQALGWEGEGFDDDELAIVRARMPQVEAALAGQLVRFVQALRAEDLEKTPGIAETLDWAAALLGLGLRDLAADPKAVQASLVCLLKTEADLKAVTPEVSRRLVEQVA